MTTGTEMESVSRETPASLNLEHVAGLGDCLQQVVQCGGCSGPASWLRDDRAWCADCLLQSLEAEGLIAPSPRGIFLRGWRRSE